MKMVIDKIIDNTPNVIRDNNKNIPKVIEFLKTLETPKKEKKPELIIEDVPDIIKIIEEKEYTENELKWDSIFKELGEKHE